VQESERRVALITGATGQDGAYLAEFLLAKGYVVHGLSDARRRSIPAAWIISITTRTSGGVTFFLHFGDATDATNIIRIVQDTQPDKIYNLAAQSHVQVSFETPEHTANADGLGTLRLLEAIRLLVGEQDPLLSSFDVRAVRQCTRNPAAGNDPVLPAFAIRSG
jgi:GDPmannose 4,6-dehydratase